MRTVFAKRSKASFGICRFANGMLFRGKSGAGNALISVSLKLILKLGEFMRGKKVIRVMATVAVICTSLFLLQRLLVPKYMSDIAEGRLIAEYYDEEKNHDVIFIGDCEVYENFSPKVLWEDFGINSYIRGSAQQLIWQSYYLLEDTLRYEKPEIVIFNVLSMQYDKPQKEAYNRMTLDGMKWSWSKMQSIQASMTGRENFLEYIFPILRYHSRWDELSSEDFEYLFKTKKASHNGYYMRVDVKPAENIPEGRVLADYKFGSQAYLYLDKMARLCKENDIELILVKAPSLYPYWYDEWEEQIEEYAARNGLRYINFLDLAAEIGVDFSKDTYDGGLHLNLYGAEKITKYLGDFLSGQVGLRDRRDDAMLSGEWEKKIICYEQEKERLGNE